MSERTVCKPQVNVNFSCTAKITLIDFLQYLTIANLSHNFIGAGLPSYYVIIYIQFQFLIMFLLLFFTVVNSKIMLIGFIF